MFLTKLKIASAVVVVTAALALTAAGGLYEAVAGDEPEAKTPTAERPATADVAAPAAKRPVEEDVQKGDPLMTTKAPPSDPVAAPSREEPRNKNELPDGPMPRQVLVRLEKGHLSVETLDVVVEPITVAPEGKPSYTSYQAVYVRRMRRYLPEMLKVYDMKGKRIDAKQLPKLLTKETIALFASTEQAADPLNLRLFKEGTLLFVLSSPITPAAPAVAVPPPPVAPIPATDPALSGCPVPPTAP